MISLKINGKERSIDVSPDTPLLWVLRENLQLTGTKFGCGMALCGACTVHLDGEAVRSCVTPIGTVAGAEITTLEGLGTAEKPHPLQQAFIDEQAAQCGFCLNGVILTAKAFLDQKPKATEAELQQGLASVLCRCFTHVRMLRAIKKYQEKRV